uniref:TOG domain-containing protein n=1 Tax=Parastrongyloides trichosuri TaxID=131310 RepID=A0A0N4ZIB0_PARTI
MKPLPKTVLSCNEMDENDGSSEKKGLKKKKPLGTKNTKSPTSTSESTNLETVLSSNSNKNQRFKDEAKLKLLKWQFEVPQPEHLQQLQSQLKEVVSIDLFNKLYNKDFKQQLKALDTLISVCDSDPEAIIVNSDLLFKWITLRILETNPSVLMKCLEFGQCISEVYKQKELMLHDVELSSFLPFLLLKTGETKEPIRIAVKKLVFDICDITSVSKVYGFLVEALKTKNSRMKTECLNIMENIIDNCYENVIGSHSASFKLIASSISDRDNNVRTAALNCFVAAYRSVGTEIYKLAGKLPDKDKAYLEERIKRSGVKEIGQRATSLPGRAKIVKPVATPIVTPNSNVRNEMFDEDNAYQQNENYNELNNDIKNSRKSMQVVEDVYDVDIDAEFPDLDINASKEASTRVTSSINVLGNKIELGNKEVYNKRELLKPKLDLKLYSNHINNIDQILYAVTSNDVKKASEGISDLFVILNNRDNFPIEVIQYKIDDIIICICRAIDIYKDNFTIQTPIPDDISTFCKNIFNLLLCTMNNQEYIETIKPETVCFFLSTVLGCVSRSFVSSNDLWKNSIHHSLNHATVKLCDNCNYNTMMIGIADCMAAHTGNNFNDKVFNLARKCMDKLSTMTTKKNNEWDAEVCLSSMNRIMKLFPTAQDKIYETTFHAIRNHIQRLIVVNKSKVRDAVSRNQHSKDKVWQYAARCLEKVMPTEIAKLDSTIMKINGMTNEEIVKLLSNIPIISCEWDAFFESAKSQDTGLVDLVIEGIKEKDPFLYQSCYRKFNLSKSLKPGCGKLWTKNILLVDSVYLNKSRIDHHMNRFKKSQEILDLVLVNKCPTRAQSIPHLNHTVITKNSIHLSSSSSALNQQSNEVQTPVSQYKKPKRLSALDRENLKEKLAQIRGL